MHCGLFVVGREAVRGAPGPALALHPPALEGATTPRFFGGRYGAGCLNKPRKLRDADLTAVDGKPANGLHVVDFGHGRGTRHHPAQQEQEEISHGSIVKRDH